MKKLDKTISNSGSIKDFKRESTNYLNLSFEKRAEVFAYLQSVAYNYTLGNPPRMDRSVHESRKLKN